MEPRVQYAKSTDGVTIGYWILGQGMPLVRLPLYPGAAMSQMYSKLPEFREHHDRLSRRFMVVFLEFRGTGHSQRSMADFSLESLVHDVEAVVDCAGLGSFALYTSSWSAPVAVAYAVNHPSRATHLILWQAYVKGPDLSPRAPLSRALGSLLEDDWAAGTEALAHFQWGLAPGQDAHSYAAALRESVTPDIFQAQWQAASRFDVTELLPQVTQPTLLLDRRGSTGPEPSDDDARDLAVRIPNAQLVMIERSSAATLDTIPIVEDFLVGARRGPAPDGLGAPTSGLTAILFADIADSTALTERLGDAAFRAKARELDGVLRTVIRDHNGTPIEGKLLGDGVLALFTSARQAIEAALACARSGDDAGLPLHLGLHAGDVIREDNNVYGGAVNIASRISGLSAPGEVLVSETVRSLARTSAGVSFEDRGEQELKGVGEKVRVWAVREGT